MISRPVIGTHVCLQCQLRLSKQINGISTFHRADTRRIRQTQLLHDDAAPKRAEGSQEHAVRRTSFRNETTDSRLSRQPMGRLYGFKGYELREQRKALNVDTLGNESEVIVLRPSGLIFRPPPQMDEIVAEKVDIMARVNAERGFPTTAEVNDNIEGFRPKEHIISAEDFKAVEHQLNRGFTTTQLANYMRKFEAKDEVAEQKVWKPKTMWTLGWMPGVSGSVDVFDEDPLRGYVSNAYTPKQRLILLLLRQCWNIEVVDLSESIGEIELHVDGVKLELLIKGSSPPLQTVSDNLISTENEKIEVFRNRNIIRITARKEKGRAILYGIQDELERFCRSEIDLTPLSSLAKRKKSGFDEQILSNEDIAELALLTDTEIKRRAGNKLEISCINKTSDLHLATQVDVAKGLLLPSSSAWYNSHEQFGCVEMVEKLLAVKYDSTDALKWRDRRRSWARWMVPVRKTSPKRVQYHNSKPDSEKPNKIQEQNDLVPELCAGSTDEISMPTNLSQKEIGETYFADTLLEEQTHWNRNYFTNTSVTIGHILHRTDSTSNTVSVPADGPMRFVPSTLNISKLFNKNSQIPRLRSSVVMKFHPSPWTVVGADAMRRFPQIEMRFVINENTQVLELKEVFAIINISRSDVMIPDRELDLHFEQRTTSRLRKVGGKNLAQIEAFLNSSQLILTEGPLKTPPSIMLPVPQNLCRVDPSLGGSSIEFENNLIDVEYILTDIDSKQILAQPFKRWGRLIYSNTCSITGGPPRTELSIRPAPRSAGSQNMDTDRVSTADLINAAYELVDVLENVDPVANLPSIRKIRPKRKEHKAAFSYFESVFHVNGEVDGDEVATEAVADSDFVEEEEDAEDIRDLEDLDNIEGKEDVQDNVDKNGSKAARQCG